MPRLPLSARIPRLGYAPSVDFSLQATLTISFLLAILTLGILAFNFWTQRYRDSCISYATSVYNAVKCEPTPLVFYSTYYTKPLASNDTGTIGIFPWQTQGIGDNNGPIDYSIVSLNWTSNALQCAMVDQVVTLHLDSDSSTTTSCYYCGPNLRMLCTSVDSERTSIPTQSALDYQQLLEQYATLFTQLHTTSTSAVADATVNSLQMVRHVRLNQLAAGVQPFNESSFEVRLGTTRGFVPISMSSSNGAASGLAEQAEALSSFIEQVTSRDLQPDTGDTTSPRRTLLVNYICTECRDVYKPWYEILAILLTSTAALSSTALTILTFLATKLVKPPTADQLSPPSAFASMPYSPTSTATGRPTLQKMPDSVPASSYGPYGPPPVVPYGLGTAYGP
ncbi:hypothetical protein JCM8547_000696 [Rhodosporidiobolus lusitaniae]